MQKFTVLLLRPDNMCNGDGNDVFSSHVEADSAFEAQELAKIEASKEDSDSDDPEDAIDVDDYSVVCVYLGHLESIAVEAPVAGMTSSPSGS